MAARYGCVMEAPAGPATEEIGDLSQKAAGPRIHLYDFVLSSIGTPADTQFDWILQRTTAHGTRGATVIPKPLDDVDIASAGADAGEGTYTIAVTNTAAEELYEIGLNLRATFRWVAAPDGEIVMPAADNEGLVWICNHASATDEMRVTAHHFE